MPSSVFGSEISVVDPKGRINVPARLRKNLAPEAADTFQMISHHDGCVRMYPLDRWREFIANLRKLSLGSADARGYLRSLSDSAHEATIDGQGRVLVSRTLLDAAGVNGQAKLVGMNQWIELWEPSRFVEGVAQGAPEDRHGVSDRVDDLMAENQ